MKLQYLLIAVLVIATLGLCGCDSNPSASQVLNSAETTGSANLNIVLSPETVSSIRAATTAYRVKVILLIANPGNATTPFYKLIKEIDIDTTANSAAATFASLPAKPVVVQIMLNNASINGARMFHAATDLVANETKTVSPDFVGAGSRTDLIARVALEFFNNPTLMAGANDGMTQAIETITNGMTEFNRMLNTAVQSFNPTGLVALNHESVTTNIKIGETVKTAEELWSGATLWTTTPANMQLQNILRQGFGGFGLTHWAHSRDLDNAIMKINTSTMARASFCRNNGKLSHFIVLKDGSVVAAGFNQSKNAPVIFRWSGLTDASTYTTSGISDSNLQWFNYFSELGTDLSGYSVEAITSDFETQVYVILKKSDGSRVEYRLNLDTGARVLVPGSVEEGLQVVTAYYPELRAILEDNSMTEAQRVSKFMTYIADDFTRIDGTANQKSDLEAVTLDRFNRWTINQYKFNLISIKAVDSSTIEVETEMYIVVKSKTSALTATVDVQPNPKITWKRYSTGWKLYKGLPYTSNELNGI